MVCACTQCVSVSVKEHRANPGGPQEQRENEKLLESAQQGFLLSLEEDSSSPAHARPGNEGGMKVGMMGGKRAVHSLCFLYLMRSGPLALMH